MLTQADGTADQALLMLYRQWRGRRQRRVTTPMSVGADKAYDTRDFVQTVREMDFRPHVAHNVNRSRGSALGPTESREHRHARHPSPDQAERKQPITRVACQMSQCSAA